MSIAAVLSTGHTPENKVTSCIICLDLIKASRNPVVQLATCTVLQLSLHYNSLAKPTFLGFHCIVAKEREIMTILKLTTKLAILSW